MAVPTSTGWVPDASLRVVEAVVVTGCQAASRLTAPAARVLNVASSDRSESGFGDPWNLPPASLIDGCSAGHRNSTSTVGVPSSADVSVTVQCACAVVDGRTKPGVPPEAHSGVAPSAEMQIFVVSVGEVVTTCADMAPGPSLANVKVRAWAALSVVESSTRLVKVISAVCETWDGSGTGMGSAVGVAVGAGLTGLTDGGPAGGEAIGLGELAPAIGLAGADAVGSTAPGPAA